MPLNEKLYLPMALVVIALSIFYAGSQIGGGSSHVITTTGEATGKAAPDMVTVSFGVQADSQTAAGAQDQVRQAASAMSDAVANVGIPQSDVKTSQVSVEPVTQYNPQTGESTSKGFRATYEFTVTTSAIDVVGPLVDDVLKAGANRVDGIDFFLSDAAQSRLKSDLLGQAAKDARDKADSMAAAVGARVTGVRSVSESSFVQPVFYAADLAKAGQSPTPVLPGQVDVTASVSAEFDVA